MLAGIVISVVVLVSLAFGLPWLAAHRDEPDTVDEDPIQRFSDSMRILRRDVIDYQEEAETEVSTPLSRKAEINELRLVARSAAKRRARVGAFLLVTALGLGVASFVDVLVWWAGLVPLGVLLVFAVVARFSVRAMHRSFDARAKRVRDGYGDEEDTTTIDLDAEQEPSVEIRVDLSAPSTTGALWDPIPVTAPTYVSQPLVPRTVRTIDLSAPVVARTVIPTADSPEAEVVAEASDAEIRELPRAVGE